MGSRQPSLKALALPLLCSVGVATAGILDYPAVPRALNGTTLPPTNSVPPTSSGPATTTTSSSSSSSASSRSSSTSSTTTTTIAGGTTGGEAPPTTTTPPNTTDGPTTGDSGSTTSTITAPPVITVDWSSVTLSSTDGVSTATHDSHGWPIIPVINCWFCPPSGGGGSSGGGIVIPGITGPGVFPPPHPDVIKSLGFSTNMPSITLDPEGDPSFPTEAPTQDPTDSPTDSPTTTVSPTSTSTTSSCKSTTTGYDEFVTCSTITGSAVLSTSLDCSTSTSTTVGCDVTETTTTTTVPACPASASGSISAAYSSAREAGATVVDGKTIPLAFWPQETDTPDTTLTGPIGLPTSITSSSSSSTTAETTTTTTTSSSSSSSESTPPATTTTDSPPETTSSAPTPTATWHLTAYSYSCEDKDDDSDFSYYSLQGYEDQNPHETCFNLRNGSTTLPQNSDTSNSCAFFSNGGWDGPHDCSSGTFDKPSSFVIRGGFCTVYSEPDCTGDSNGLSAYSYQGCTSVEDGWVDFDSWGSFRCFAFPNQGDD
ncbi:hypothetical protein F5Y17DRAFT_476083 [Xylariaceae sp. FL0594]|nr:hypothetical protein F5Y17DRAFT_476083 [Xylariaceae sp. FL0594]